MIIIPQLGHYFRKRRLGFVAEYCPRCRDAKAFHFFEILKYLTIWNIPIPPGYVCAHEIHCHQCDMTLVIDEERYGRPLKDKKLSIDLLIQQTNPGLWDELERREQLKTRAAQGVAEAVEKVTAIAEVIGAYEDEAAKRAGEVNIEGWGTVTFSLMLVLPIVTFFLDARSNWPVDWLGKLILAQEAALLPVLLYFIATDARRYCHRKLLPRMLPGLHEYQPNDGEIKAALRDLDRQGYIVSRKLDPARVIESYRRFSKSLAWSRCN